MKTIRRIWNRAKHPFGQLWRWATKPRGKRGRHRRWKRLVSWSHDHLAIARKHHDLPRLRKFRKAYHAYRVKRRHTKAHPHDAPKPTANLVSFDGHTVPGWIAAILQDARSSGAWGGSVISGFRSPSYSTSLCEAMCGAPSCPGRCAGAASNHACPPTGTGVPYEGAVDVSDFSRLEAYCRAHGKPLYGGGYHLPYDLPHFSHTGN